MGESEGVVNEFGDIRCSDHTCIASEDRALNTSGAPANLLRGTHGVDIIVIRRNAELWLVRITPNSEPVTADENLLADLIHTGAGAQVHGDTEVLLLAVNDLLDDHGFVEVTGIIIGGDSSADIDTEGIGLDCIDGVEIEPMFRVV